MAGPNIVWVTLESVRMDHTSLGGHEVDTTPNLSRIAERDTGVSFSNCVSQSMWTPASSASILTGTHLFTHTVGLDGQADTPLPAEIRTLPELLREEGYRTACLSPNAYLSSATGLDRGFDDMLWLSLQRLHKNRETIGPLLRYLLRIRQYGPGFTRDGRLHNQTYPLKHVANRRLRSLANDDDPFFLYVHCPNPHHPYTPPRKWREAFIDRTSLSVEDALELSLDTFRTQADMKRAIANGCAFTDDEWAALKALYDAEIAYADEFVGSVFETIVEDVGDETIVVITADHGDLFGEHGLLGHNLVLHDGVIHVPLVIYGLEGIAEARNRHVQHIDVTTTIADHVGVSHPQFQGTNLRSHDRKYAISQRGVAHFDDYLEHNAAFDVSRFQKDPMTAMRSDEFKYIHGSTRQELVRLGDEEVDVSAEYEDMFEQMARQTETTLDGLDAPDSSTDQTEFTEEMKEQLSDLGYI